MTSGQRKAHKFIWITLIILIPIIIIFSLRSIHFQNYNYIPSGFLGDSNKKFIKEAENETVKIFLYEDSIEIKLNTNLNLPSLVVYTLDSGGNKKEMIGQITNVSFYKFGIKEIPKGILIFDAIKEIKITELRF